MKLIMLMMLSCTLVLSMEQPLQVAQLASYTLISNDGKEVVLDGNIVHEHLPGLAERFRAGMIEARTGKITFADLDEQALLNLKLLLNDYSALKNEFEQQKTRIAEKVKIENYLVELTQMEKTLIEQLNLKIAKLPGIGDHFIPLFNELIGWDAPVLLEDAMAHFVADQLSFNEAYELFKDSNPIAQLLYLNEPNFEVDDIMMAFNWVIRLKEYSETHIFLSRAKDLLEKFEDRLINFVSQNIESILIKYPDFKKLFNNRLLFEVGIKLKESLSEVFKKYSKKILRPVVGSKAKVFRLGDDSILLIDASNKDNFYNTKTQQFQTILRFIIDNKLKLELEYRAWGADKIILFQPGDRSVTLVDRNTDTVVFNKPLAAPRLVNVLPLNDKDLILLSKKAVATDRRLAIRLLEFKNEGYELSKDSLLPNLIDLKVLASDLVVLVQEIDGYYSVSLQDSILGKPLKKREFRKNQVIDQIDIIQNNIFLWITEKNQQGTIKKLIVMDITFNDTKSYLFPFEVSVLDKFFPLNAGHILIANSTNRTLQLINLLDFSKKDLDYLDSIVVIDKSHFAGVQAASFVIISEVSTIFEVLDEIQKKITSQSPVPQKRSASPLREAPIPAAAKGLKPEAREAKRPREEKPNG